MAAKLSALRSQVEQALTGRVASPFTYRDRHVFPTVSSGIPEIDSLTGGLPRGAMIEIFGPACSGATSFLFSALNARTQHEEACALIDGSDAFDPWSAAAAGVDLKKLLWVRCHNIDQTLRATDLLLQSGGFSFIAVDVGDIAPKLVRHVPLDTWFRFRRAVEDTSTILMLLSRESNAKTCASLVLHLEGNSVRWLQTAHPDARNSIFSAELRKESHAGTKTQQRAEVPAASFVDRTPNPSAWLLHSLEVRAEILRSRLQRPADPFAPQKLFSDWNANRESTETAAQFRAEANWASASVFRGSEL